MAYGNTYFLTAFNLSTLESDWKVARNIKSLGAGDRATLEIVALELKSMNLSGALINLLLFLAPFGEDNFPLDGFSLWKVFKPAR